MTEMNGDVDEMQVSVENLDNKQLLLNHCLRVLKEEFGRGGLIL